VLHRWRQLTQGRLSADTLVEFHSRHKFIVMAHQLRAYKKLGLLVAGTGKTGVRELGEHYIAELMQALKHIATRKQHANVLEHLLGYLKTKLGSADKQEMLETIRAYQRGELPLIVPITLLKYHFRHYPDPYIQQQYYLAPHPQELMLRNLL
jgi:uncharacterized protein YbgA (DUF1722 family)